MIPASGSVFTFIVLSLLFDVGECYHERFERVWLEAQLSLEALAFRLVEGRLEAGTLRTACYRCELLAGSSWTSLCHNSVVLLTSPNPR